MASAKDYMEAKFKANTDEAQKSIKGLVKSVKNLTSEVMASAEALVKFGKKLAQLTDYSDKLTVSQRLLNNVLGDNVDQANKFVNQMTRMTGISESVLNKTVVRFAQLGQSYGMANEEAEKLAESATILSTKLALLYNEDPETMASKLTKALNGSKKALLETTGIVATQTEMQAILYENGINRQVSSLNQSEQAILRYIAISRQATKDTEAYAQAVNSLAWQKQMLTQQVMRLKTAIGQLLTPALTQIYTVLNAIIIVITEIIKLIGKFMGITIDTSTSAGGAISSIADDYDDLTSSIDNASKAANRSLRGFDKLNNITTPKETSKSGTAGLGIDPAITGLLADTNDQMLEIENNAQKIADQILKWLGFTKDENGELQWSGDVLKNNIFDFIKKNWLWLIGVPAALLLIWQAFKKIKGLDMAGALDKLASTVKYIAIAAIIAAIAFAIKELAEVLRALKDTGLEVGEALGLLSGLLTIIIGAATAIIALGKAINSPKVLLGILIALGTVVALLFTLKDTLPTILDALGDLIVKIGPTVVDIIHAIGEEIIKITYVLGKTMPPIIESFGTMFKRVLEGVGEIVESFGNIVTNILGGVKDVIKQIGDTITQVAYTIVWFFNNIGPAMNNFVDNMIIATTKLINFIISGIEYLINRAVDGVNNIISMLNGLPLIGGMINIPMRGYVYIPRFSVYAQGGFPEDGFFYANHNELVGEFSNGRTAVANNEQIIKGIQGGVFNGMMSALSNTDFGGNVTIEASGDTDGLLNFISFKQKQKSRQFN